MPPAYPTRVRTTPVRLPNRESGPQNQPRAKVAVSVLVGAERSIGGIATLASMPLWVMSILLVSLLELKNSAAEPSPANMTIVIQITITLGLN